MLICLRMYICVHTHTHTHARAEIRDRQNDEEWILFHHHLPRKKSLSKLEGQDCPTRLHLFVYTFFSRSLSRIFTQ